MDGSADLLTKTQVAKLLGVSRQTVWTWERSGHAPPYVRIKKRSLYPKIQMLEWFEHHKLRKANAFDVFAFLAGTCRSTFSHPYAASPPTHPDSIC